MQQGQLVPLIKTVHASTFVSLLKHFEQDIYPLLETVGLPEDILSTKHEYIPETPIKHLLVLMAERADPEHYGQLLCTAIKEYFIPKILRHLDKPATIGDALEQLKTAVLHDSPATELSIQHFNGTPWICRHKEKKETSGFMWAEIFAVLYMVEFIRFAAKQPWLPNYIALQSEGASQLKAILKTDKTVFYTERSLAAIEVSNDIMSLPCHLPVSFDRAGEDQTQQPDAPSFIESIYLALAPYLSRQDMNIEQAAAILDTSTRTLQRRLAAEHTSFKNVKDNIMLATACRLMENPELSLTDISTELGYANIAHFSRAFKKLTGFPPKAYRKRFLNGTSV
ncbi:AraC family transcriptional regulator [Photobacterium sanctipauli]|uniref:AraC family transcriptional regulator n=1 Tax=Photobacterium sanctipauli TaxID=1342794 RepID=A0A2T3NN23_9GAMM|nr:helix-turn-helix domain-containing protein [Photobacterium sanctipauli]PSW16915.1 AraC family transcriptional regulator [Photobacterium sanctipauli]